MSPSEAFPFSVKVNASTSDSGVSLDTEVTVLDGRDEVRGTGRGQVDLALKRGLYTVRLDRAGLRTEEVRRHTGPTELRLQEPQRYSAVPASDTATTHEYYQGPARHWSRHTTSAPLAAEDGPPGSLFIFLRAPSAESVSRDPAETCLRICRYDGTELTRLGPPTTESDPRRGWLAFHAVVAAGEYVLHYDRPPGASAGAREMAIAIFADWQTELFMTLADGPSFGSASVLMTRGGFDPDNRVAQAVDAALSGLQNGTHTIAFSERQMLLMGKFENPMLGLIGTHLLFRSADATRNAADEILTNLGRLLGDAPDVRALALLAHHRLDRPFDPAPFERPPLLRAGLEVVLTAAGEMPELVPEDSDVARIALERFTDSPWSTWRPFTGDPLQVVAAPEWVEQYVEDAVSRAASRDAPLDVAKIAAKARLPPSSIAKVYEQLRNAMPPGRARTLEMTRLMARSRRAAKDSPLTAADAATRFFAGSEGERIEVLGIMQGNADLRDLDVALEGVRASRSAFEQYQAIRLAQQMVPNLDPDQRAELASTLEQHRGEGTWIVPGTDRWYLSGQVLWQLWRS
jgi:hypothetical protein